MAEGSPNTNPMKLSFETSLDNSGFEQGADELKKNLTSFKKTITQLSEDSSKVFSTTSAKGGAKVQVKTFEELKEKVSEFAQACESIDGSTIGEALEIFSEMEKMLEGFAESWFKLESGLAVPGKMTKQFEEMSKALAQLKQHMEEVIANTEASETGDTADLQAIKNQFEDTIKVLSQAETVEQAKEAYASLVEQMKAFADLKFDFGEGIISGKDLDTYKEMCDVVEELAERLKELGIDPDIEQLKEDAEEIPDKAKEAGDAAEDAAEQAGDAAKQAGQDVNDAEEVIQSAFDKSGDAAEDAGDAAKDAGDDTQDAMDGAADAANNAGNAMNGAANSANNAGNAISSNTMKVSGALSGASKSAKGAGKSADGLGKKLAGLVKGGLKKAWGGLKDLQKECLNLPKRLGKAVSNKVVAGFKNLAGSIMGAGNAAKQFGQRATLSFRQVLGYAIGITSLAKLFSTLKSAIMEGFNKLLEVDPELKGTVDSMNQSVALLKMNFAAAFLPLLDIVLPVIQTIINALSQAIDCVGQFIAALSGRSTYKRVVANQNAAAASAANMEDAYNDATEAAKKEQKTIASFDELHILNENEDNNKNTPQKGGANDPATMLEEVPVANGMKDLLDSLKDMWDKADFFDLGKMLGENLKKFLDSIPWDEIQAFAEKLGKSLATLLNGFMSVPGLFYSIGKTIAEVINTIFHFLHGLVDALDWNLLGQSIKDFIMGLLENIDWPLIYDTFAKLGAGIGTALESAFDNPEIWTAIFTTISNVVRALLLLLYNLFTTPNWASIAQNIGIGLNAGVEAFPWDLLADTIAAALNMVFSFVYNFLTTFNFRGLGEHIGQSITRAVGEVDWSTGGAALAAAFNALFDFINGILVETDWALIGKSIIEFIGGFFTTLDLSKWGEYLGNFWTTVFEFLTGAIQEVDWAALPGHIVDKIREFLSGFNWEETAHALAELLGSAFGAVFSLAASIGGSIYNAFTSIPDGFFNAIGEGIKNVVAWLKEHFLTPFLDAFHSVFEINSPSKVMEPIGSSILEGVGQGIISWVAGILSWLNEHVFTPVVDGFKSIFGIGSDKPALFSIGTDLISGLGGGIIEWVTGVPGWLKEHVGGPIVDGVKSIFGIGSGDPALAESGMETIDGFKNGMTNALGNAFGWVKDNIVSKIVDPVKEGFGINGSESSTFSEYGDAVTSSMGSSIEAGGEQIQQTVSNLTETMQGYFKNVDWSQFGTLMITGLVAGITQGKEAFTTAVLETVGGAVTALHSFFSNVDWSQLSGMVITGLTRGFNSGKTALLEAVKQIGAGILNAVKAALVAERFVTIGAQVCTGLARGITGSAKTVASAAKALTTVTITALKQMTDTKNIGVQVVDGIKNGITASTNSLISIIKSAVTEPVKKALKDGLGTSGTPFSTEDGKKFIEGLKNGITQESASLSDFIIKTVVTPIKASLKEGLGTEKTPFSTEDGMYIIKGLMDGMTTEAGNIPDFMEKEVMEPLISAVRGALGIDDEGGSSVFREIGETAIDSLFEGLDVDESTVTDRVGGTISTIMDAFNDADWDNIGTYIIEGIDEGLYNGWDWIYNEVTSLANALLEAAYASLGISSPSKEFAWIGEMITKGLAAGMDGSQKEAVASAQDLAEAVIEGADGIDPTISMETAVDGLDDVLTTFSDKVANSFADMIGRLEAIVTGSSFYMPAAASGAVLPFSARGGASGLEEDTMSQILDRLTTTSNLMMTRSDFQEILERVFRDYMNISFYMGDEEVARHANAGNARINRRYSAVASD